MKFLKTLFFIILVFAFVNSDAQIYKGLQEFDTLSVLGDGIFYTKEKRANGTYGTKQLPYSVFVDSLINSLPDLDPTGALMGEKFRTHKTWFLGDTTGYYATWGRTAKTSKGNVRISTWDDLGHSYLNKAGLATILLNEGGNAPFFSQSQFVRNLDDAHAKWSVASYYQPSGIPGAVGEGAFHLAMKPVLEISVSTHQEDTIGNLLYGVENAGIFFQPEVDQTQLNRNMSIYFKTTKDGASSMQNSLVIDKNGKWFGDSYANGFAKFTNGVLEELTSSELISNLFSTTPVQFGSAAVANGGFMSTTTSDFSGVTTFNGTTQMNGVVTLPVYQSAPANPSPNQICLHDIDGDGDGDNVLIYLNGTTWIQLSEIVYSNSNW